MGTYYAARMTNDERILRLRDWFASEAMSLTQADRLAVEHALIEPNLRLGWIALDELQARLPPAWGPQISDYYSAVY